MNMAFLPKTECSCELDHIQIHFQKDCLQSSKAEHGYDISLSRGSATVVFTDFEVIFTLNRTSKKFHKYSWSKDTPVEFYQQGNIFRIVFPQSSTIKDESGDKVKTITLKEIHLYIYEIMTPVVSFLD